MPMASPTNSHEVIRSWAATNGAVPVEVATKVFDGEPTKLGFIFARGSMRAPEFTPISWDAFFSLFDLLGLAFVYDEARPDLYELLQSDARHQAGFAVGAN